MTTHYTLEEIANRLGLELKGDGTCRIRGMATLLKAEAEEISFLANPKYRRYLPETQASAVIVKEADWPLCPTNALLSRDPYLSYAQLASFWAEDEGLLEHIPGIHPTAVVASSARIDPTASIGPHVVIGDWVEIGPRVSVGAGSVIGSRSQLSEGVFLHPRVTLYPKVKIGERSVLHSGVVVGSDGFGFANDAGKWIKIPQKGGVQIGAHVEIGANTTIDCGALDDTWIGDGVKLDNQIQIGHNVRIGEHTIVAGCVGIAGSTEIGAHCAIGGASGIAGHLVIADQVVVAGMSMVTQSIQKPGVYSSGTGLLPNSEWRKAVVRFRQLDDLSRRVTKMEKEWGDVSNE